MLSSVSSTYFDVSVCFTEDSVEENRHVDRVDETRVQRVKVRLDRGPFHHQILPDPFPQLIVVRQHFFQLFGLEECPGQGAGGRRRVSHLLREIGEGEIVEGKSDFIVDLFGRGLDSNEMITGIGGQRANVRILSQGRLKAER